MEKEQNKVHIKVRNDSKKSFSYKYKSFLLRSHVFFMCIFFYSFFILTGLILILLCEHNMNKHLQAKHRFSWLHVRSLSVICRNSRPFRHSKNLYINIFCFKSSAKLHNLKNIIKIIWYYKMFKDILNFNKKMEQRHLRLDKLINSLVVTTSTFFFFFKRVS